LAAQLPLNKTRNPPPPLSKRNSITTSESPKINTENEVISNEISESGFHSVIDIKSRRVLSSGNHSSFQKTSSKSNATEKRSVSLGAFGFNIHPKFKAWPKEEEDVNSDASSVKISSRPNSNIFEESSEETNEETNPSNATDSEATEKLTPKRISKSYFGWKNFIPSKETSTLSLTNSTLPTIEEGEKPLIASLKQLQTDLKNLEKRGSELEKKDIVELLNSYIENLKTI
jgi:hypothetical protein